MKTFSELISTRRSIRKYTSAPIEKEKINRILTSGLMSPSSKRSNSWEFIVVENKEKLTELADCKQHGSHFLSDAPLAIVVIADTTKSDVWMEDAAIAAIIMQLQAHELGLGSCWIQTYARYKDGITTSESYIRGILNIPDHYAVMCILSIGYPAEEKKAFDENKLEIKKIHSEFFSI